ncbi:MAG: hypothetical protein Q8O25_03190, partial [Sulfurisoma sp.]|nr:hypothetical protein [Sulfurisoma sp.]
MRIDPLPGQVCFQDGADESFVAEKYARDTERVEIDQGIAFVDVGVDRMNCVSRGTPRIGQMTVELALDGSRIRRMPDKRRALAQRGKPGVPVSDKAFPDRVVVAVARTGANQLQRRNFPIAQRRRKSPSAQPRLHNDFA